MQIVPRWEKFYPEGTEGVQFLGKHRYAKYTYTE